MSTTTKVILGLAGGALVAGGALYLLGRRANAVAQPTGATAPTTTGAVKSNVVAGWDALWGLATGGLRSSVDDMGIATGTAQAEDTPIIGNRNSAPTDAQLTVIGVHK